MFLDLLKEKSVQKGLDLNFGCYCFSLYTYNLEFKAENFADVSRRCYKTFLDIVVAGVHDCV
jgi:hypothetical protein